MSWISRVLSDTASQTTNSSPTMSNEAQMHPGLTNEYDWELREKAGLHSPPPPPEFMGIEGEYDLCGLGKRVAAVLDAEAVEDIQTLYIVQQGSTICLLGSITNQHTLDHIVDLACHVDGTKAVDTRQVRIET